MPFLVADRMPLKVAGLWPHWFDHLAAAYGVSVSLTVMFLPSLRVSSVLEAKSFAPATVKFYCEYVQMGCAVLSFGYLLVLWVMESHGKTIFLTSLYHVIWTYLRPLYTLLFLLYWLKRLPRFGLLQALVCGTCFFYFLIFCPLTETKMTFIGGSRFDYDGPEQRTPLAPASHKLEALCFYLSMILFFTHGLLGAQWCRSQSFQRGMACLAVLIFSVAALCEVDRMSPLAWLEELSRLKHHWGYLFGFIMLHYGLGYGSILLINGMILNTSVVDVRPFTIVLEADKAKSISEIGLDSLC